MQPFTDSLWTPPTALTNCGGFVCHVESGPRGFCGKWQWEPHRYPHTQTDVHFKWAQIAYTVATLHVDGLIRETSLALAPEMCDVGGRENWGFTEEAGEVGQKKVLDPEIWREVHANLSQIRTRWNFFSQTHTLSRLHTNTETLMTYIWQEHTEEHGICPMQLSKYLSVIGFTLMMQQITQPDSLLLLVHRIVK